jgi:hypothetical protein
MRQCEAHDESNQFNCSYEYDEQTTIKTITNNNKDEETVPTSRAPSN